MQWGRWMEGKQTTHPSLTLPRSDPAGYSFYEAALSEDTHKHRSAISFYLYLRPSASSRSSHGAVTLRCLTPPLQRWAAPPHLPTPVLLSSCSLDKAITPLCKQFIIIQKEATAFETNTFQITDDGLWFLIVGFCFFFNLWGEVKAEMFCSLFEGSVCLWGLGCCDIRVEKGDCTGNTHAYSAQLVEAPVGKRLKPISPVGI